MRRPVAMTVAACVLVGASGCGIPRDPDHTLDRIDQDHVVVVGVAPAPPQVELRGTIPVGPEAELVTGFARSRGARVRWVVAGQEELVKQLEDGQVDLVVGGLTSRSPFSSRVGLTRAYAVEVDAHGDRVKRVVAVPLGENALVAALEGWFDRGRP